jgi:hypothetical protein
LTTSKPFILPSNRRVNFESVKPKGENHQSYKVDVKNIDYIINSSNKRQVYFIENYRSQTIKARARHHNVPSIGGAYYKSDVPSSIGKVRQSLDFPLGNEPEDFIINDTDERVTSQK